jgi:hypothetical protein
MSCSMRRCNTGLIHTSGKAIFELIVMEDAYVRDLQLVVVVCDRFLYLVNDMI